MIKLYYISGITESDTLYPSVVSEDVEEVYSDGFYPPYYKNIIELRLDNVAPFNYLSLDFNGKTYYYFIDKVEYVNDALDCKLHVHMDTIMTFYDDITLVPGTIIERKFINRLKPIAPGALSYGINRDYVRENVSNGTFELISKRVLRISDLENEDGTMEDYYIDGWYVFKLASFTGDWRGLTNTSSGKVNQGCLIAPLAVGSAEVQSPFVYFLVPKIKGLYPNSTLTIHYENQDFTGYEIGHTIDVLSKSPDVVSAYYLPYNPFNFGVASYDTTNNKLNVGSNIAPLSLEEPTWLGNKTIVLTPLKDVSLVIEDIYSYYEIFDLITDDFIGNIYQLLDNNYLRVCYGTSEKQSIVDLFLVKENGLNLEMYDNIDSGDIYYYITPHIHGNYYYQSYLLTNNLDNLVKVSPIYLPLKNDSWLQYYEYNKASLFVGVSSAASSLLGSAITGSGYGVGRGIGRLTSEFERPINALFAPDSIKNGDGLIASMVADNISPVLYVYRVTDFEKCKWYYHMNGYLVNEMVKSNTPLNSNVFKTRTNFNILKTSETNVNVYDLADEEIRNDVIRRLEQGVRWWSVRIGDNVNEENAEVQ